MGKTKNSHLHKWKSLLLLYILYILQFDMTSCKFPVRVAIGNEILEVKTNRQKLHLRSKQHLRISQCYGLVPY